MSSVNLGAYIVLDCEPLHDLKGHLINFLTEIQYIFKGDSKKAVSELLDHLLFSRKQNGYSGSDLRIALIQLNKYVQSKDTFHLNVKQLLSTAAKISECLYASCSKRTPKAVLQLYNATWLHHELCKTLFPRPHTITYEKMFGTYLHSLVVHAPRQYEIVSLRSINTEKNFSTDKTNSFIMHKSKTRKCDTISVIENTGKICCRQTCESV